MASALLVLALAACGGGGGGGEAPGQLSGLRSGEIDRAYGGGGSVLLPSATAMFNGMAVARDGSVFLAGQEVIKLDPNGALDATYGTAGRVQLPSFSPVLDDAGNLYVLSGLSVAKLDPTGRFDLSFGVNGHAVVDANWREFDMMVHTLLRDREGNLFVAASTMAATPPHELEVVKLGPDGRRVASYGDGGSVVFRSSSRLTAAAMAIDSQGNLYVGGAQSLVLAHSTPFLMVAKADREGRPDPNFGQAGIWVDTSCASSRGVLSLAIDPLDQVVLGGECHAFSSDALRATVRKLDSRGNIVPFRDPGHELFGADAQEAAVLIVGPAGQIHVAGSRRSSVSCFEAAVAKLSSDGSFVPGFGVGGVVGLGVTGRVRDLESDAQGRIHVGLVDYPACPTLSTTPFYQVYRLGG